MFTQTVIAAVSISAASANYNCEPIECEVNQTAIRENEYSCDWVCKADPLPNCSPKVDECAENENAILDNAYECSYTCEEVIPKECSPEGTTCDETQEPVLVSEYECKYECHDICQAPAYACGENMEPVLTNVAYCQYDCVANCAPPADYKCEAGEVVFLEDEAKCEYGCKAEEITPGTDEVCEPTCAETKDLFIDSDIAECTFECCDKPENCEGNTKPLYEGECTFTCPTTSNTPTDDDSKDSGASLTAISTLLTTGAAAFALFL